MQEWAYEKARATVEEDLVSTQELYYGIGFLFYSEIISRDQYDNLMRIFRKNHPDYIEEVYE